ncbi:hypothetical protein PTMSG1_02234 [Pyrenophora teres f. maculata]|nr:hypothetical protein PTMSG1_02234 [Pyrenophora teres f. maculata]
MTTSFSETNFCSIHRQYKQDTDIVLSWLTGTGTADWLSANSIATCCKFERACYRFERQDTKASRQNKDRGVRGKAILTIRTKDFEPMVECVTNNMVEPSIPASVERLFQCMLNTCERVTNWFSDYDQGDTQITKQHAVFNQTLDRTFEILRPFVKTNGRKKATEVTAEDFHVHTHALQDNLSKLTVNETVKSKRKTKPSATEDDDVEETVEENFDTFSSLPRVHIERDELELEEFYLTIMMFLVEIIEIGQKILNIWRERA